MREYLFRGRRTENEAWVEGCYMPPTRNHGPAIGVFDPVPEYIGCWEWYEIDPATVGQFTGLVDKNEKKIFEGDIVKTKEYGKDNGSGRNFWDYDLFQIAFADGGFCVENIRRRFNLCRGNILEVIGNIHDNPELLEATPC